MLGAIPLIIPNIAKPPKKTDSEEKSDIKWISSISCTWHVFSIYIYILLSQTLDKQTLDTKIPRQANTRHDNPLELISIRDNKP